MFCCQRRRINDFFFVLAFKCIYNTVNTNYPMNQWSQSISNIKNLIIWIFIMLLMYCYVSCAVPGMWQWDSPHLQVADLQGAPWPGPRGNCPQCPHINPALLMVLYLDHMCQCGLHAVLCLHIGTPMHRLTAEPCSTYSITFIPFSVSLWNDLANPVFHGVGLAGFKSRANASLLA